MTNPSSFVILKVGDIHFPSTMCNRVDMPCAIPERIRIDYRPILSWFLPCPVESLISRLREELPYLWLDAYQAMIPRQTNVVQFQCGTFDYIYDDYASLEAWHVVPRDSQTEARLVAALGRSNPQKRKRDDGRLKGWVGSTESLYGAEWDKGHFIAHSIGGAVDQSEVNVLVQRRDLNRGRSVEGRRYVEMEKYCRQRSGTFCFTRAIYFD